MEFIDIAFLLHQLIFESISLDVKYCITGNVLRIFNLPKLT